MSKYPLVESMINEKLGIPNLSEGVDVFAAENKFDKLRIEMKTMLKSATAWDDSQKKKAKSSEVALNKALDTAFEMTKRLSII